MATDYKALGEEFEATPGDLEKHLPRILEEIVKDDSQDGAFVKKCKWSIRDHVFKEAKTAKNQHEAIIVKICIESMRKRKEPYYDLAKFIFDEKSLVKWKGNESGIEEIVQVLEEPFDWIPTKDDEKRDKMNHVSWSDLGSKLKDAVEKMIDACKRDKILKKVGESFARLVTSCLESSSPMHVVIAIPFTDSSDMSWEGNEKLIPGMMEAYNKWLRRDDLDFEENRDHKELARSMSNWHFLENAGKKTTIHLRHIMEHCLDQELEGDNNVPLSVHGDIIRNIINSFILKNHDKVKQYEDLMPSVVKLLDCEVKDLTQCAGYVFGIIHQNADVIAPYAEPIVEAYLDGKGGGTSLGLALKALFKVKPEVILERIDRFAEMLEDMGGTDKTYLYMMFDDVAKKNSEALAPLVDVMMEDVLNPSLAATCFMALAEISIKHPEKFVKHIDRCLQAWEQIPYTVASASKTIASIGRMDMKRADQCMKIFFDKIKTIDPMWISVILMELKRIGHAHKEALKPYRAEIEKLKLCQQMGVADMVQAMLDFLDDRTLQGLSEDVAEQRDDIDNLDSRVTNTENDVKILDETVAQQGDDIQNVKNEVNEQGERLDELKEVVDETVEKVEEIDHKTITNAPKWSRDVSKLLNPEHEHDWRYLAVRLGYSGEDIRNWALSPDPTMAILAEWYTTHKSSDATYAILSALEDMGRTDAAEIINQSLEEAEMLVPRAPSDDQEKPPAVFLSYQWDHQPEVKAIKHHLERAGFPCWMDIGQMGGGDQLFARISQGMRSSKLVLCMVTEKYSSSENCNKEVNLANLLNKPIIPILIDHTPWPPEGAMSMLFAQLLYIQFFNDKEYVRGDKFWDDAKFSELLGQISYHVNPDQSMVAEEYKNWIPEVEDAPVVTKKVSQEPGSGQATQQSTGNEPSEPPSVFISYQWGKQPEIKRLFSRLTGLGYHCWLDINQMGGGDPLYSKIDKGVRNAKVVISCVTPKYALSANCRREVSLSDALRKPIIPLLLEDMTWPPEGPMSMTLTQLLYIDFTKETSQQSFEDEKFDELLSKIQAHAEPTLDLSLTSVHDGTDDPEQGSGTSIYKKADDNQEMITKDHVEGQVEIEGDKIDGEKQSELVTPSDAPVAQDVPTSPSSPKPSPPCLPTTPSPTPIPPAHVPSRPSEPPVLPPSSHVALECKENDVINTNDTTDDTKREALPIDGEQNHLAGDVNPSRPATPKKTKKSKMCTML